MKIGLARVSTRDQHPEAQQDALRAAGCEKVFTDKASGKLARRPGLDNALMIARRGDQIVVTKLDRLGRSLEHLIELSKDLQDRGVDLVVLDQGIDTSTPHGRLFFSIIGAIAESSGRSSGSAPTPGSPRRGPAAGSVAGARSSHRASWRPPGSCTTPRDTQWRRSPRSSESAGPRYTGRLTPPLLVEGTVMAIRIGNPRVGHRIGAKAAP